MKKILIVVDMQNDFIDGSLGTAEAVAIVDNVVDKIINFDGEIIVTQDTHFENYLQTAEGGRLPVEHCIKGTHGWQVNDKIVKALSEYDNIHYVEKLTFGSVDLPGLIKEIVDDDDFSIELVGLCTDICVVSNALLLKANYPEKTITVDSSCCAGVTPESHKMALNTMTMCQIEIK